MAFAAGPLIIAQMASTRRYSVSDKEQRCAAGAAEMPMLLLHAIFRFLMPPAAVAAKYCRFSRPRRCRIRRYDAITGYFSYFTMILSLAAASIYVLSDIFAFDIRYSFRWLSPLVPLRHFRHASFCRHALPTH